MELTCAAERVFLHKSFDIFCRLATMWNGDGLERPVIMRDTLGVRYSVAKIGGHGQSPTSERHEGRLGERATIVQGILVSRRVYGGSVPRSSVE